MHLKRSFAEVKGEVVGVPARSLYSSDDWFALLDDHGHDYRYLLIEDGAGGATTFTALTDGPAVHSHRYHPDYLLDRALPATSCVVAGPRTGYHNEIRGGAPTMPPSAVAARLLDLAPEGAVLLPYLPGETAAELAALGHPAGLIAWESWLDVPSGGFDAYLAALPRSRREQVKGDLRKVRGAGLSFRTVPLDAAPHADMAEVLVLHEKKYDPAYDRPSADFARYLGRCTEVPGAYAILAEFDGRLVGCHVVFHYADVLWARLIGVDESLPETGRCYFSLMFYEPLRLAQRLAAPAVNLGIGTSEAKVRRGARLEPLWTVALAAEGAVRHQAREGLLRRARNLPDPVPDGVGVPLDRPSSGAAEP
ncbi:GNAT family N-acetyltransferase [Streptomyces sp. NPDC020731]|uniref:GNAT family N-acetyltransferase n=1 Tax=Streptomyces sp. NPDC020731 TaxID=3365085 RepID=UPI0037A12AD5